MEQNRLIEDFKLLINDIEKGSLKGDMLVCEAVGSVKAVYNAVDGMNRYILISMIRDIVEEW